MVDVARLDQDRLREIMGGKPADDPAAHYLRDIIPQYSRVQVPLDEAYRLRTYADLLRGLASQLDFISRRPDLSETQALFLAHSEIKSTNYKMLNLTKSGGPK